MSLPVTFSQLRQEARQLADLKAPNNFVDETQLGTLVNRSCQRLWRIINQKYGDNYFVSTYVLTTIGGQDTYPLPSDFSKLLGVNLQIDAIGTPAPRKLTLTHLPYNERNIFNNLLPTSWLLFGLTNVRYYEEGENLIFRPLPVPSLAVIELKYVPVFQYLVADADTWLHGEWAEFITTDTALKLAAIDSDTERMGYLNQRLAELTQEMEVDAENRDAGESFRVMDVNASKGTRAGSTSTGGYW